MFAKVFQVLPGFIAALLIALIAKSAASLPGANLIGASIISMFVGMLFHAYFKSSALIPGIRFTSKKILKFAIVLLGASLSIETILTVGKHSLTVMIFTLLTCFGGGYFIGKSLGLNWKLSNLISAGTGICGGSAVAAIAPVVDAEDTDIAYAISATFLFDMFMILMFPFMGRWLGLTDMQYGLWAGTAVNDTASVVAAGYAFSDAAGDFATMVKLTRTLSIIPAVLFFAYLNTTLKQKQEVQSSGTATKVNFLTLFPWFIVGFVALAVVNSFGLIPQSVSLVAKDTSKFLMVAALGAIGMNTSFKDLKKLGMAPMVHGFVVSTLVIIVAIIVIMFI